MHRLRQPKQKLRLNIQPTRVNDVNVRLQYFKIMPSKTRFAYDKHKSIRKCIYTLFAFPLVVAAHIQLLLLLTSKQLITNFVIHVKILCSGNMSKVSHRHNGKNDFTEFVLNISMNGCIM